MAETNSKKPKTHKIIVGIFCVALILVVTSAGIYYLSQPKSQPEASIDVVTNFNDDAWLKTKIVSYDDTGTTIEGEGYVNSLVKSRTYDGKACWIFSDNFTFTYTNGTVRDDF